MGNEQSAGHALGPIHVPPAARRLAFAPVRLQGERGAEGSEPAQQPGAADQLDTSVKTPWWLPLLQEAAAGAVHTSVFDFSPFASLRPGGTAGDAAGAAGAPTAAELAALDDADDDTLRSLVEEAQTKAEAAAAEEEASLRDQLAQLDASRKELEMELQSARQAADRAPDSAAAEAERSRCRRLGHCLDVNARQRAALACRQVFKAADGFKAAFGGGGVLVGVGEMVDDSVEVGLCLEAAGAGGATLRVRLGAPGPVSPDGKHPPGGAKAVMRLSKLGVRGEGGVPGIVNINADSVTVSLEFTLQVSVTYSASTKTWATCDGGVRLDIQKLDQKTSGLVLADTGLPLLEMPPDLLKLVLGLLLPRSVEDALVGALPRELGDYLLAAGCGPASLVGAMSTRGAPLRVLDVNMCCDSGGDAAPAEAARQLAQLEGPPAAGVLAQALTDWKQLGLSLGPDARKHLLLGLPAGDAGVERGRVSLGDLQRYAHRVAAWGPQAERAFGLLWDRALAKQQAAAAGAPTTVRVSAALQAARALGRRPVRGVMTLYTLRGGVNVHAAARAAAAAERRRSSGGAAASAASNGDKAKAADSTFEQLLSNLDAVAANITRSSATLAMRMEDGVMQLEASRVKHEGPVSVWTTLPLLRRGLLDLRRTSSARPHPPLPLLLRATVETRPCVRPVAAVAAAAAAEGTTPAVATPPPQDGVPQAQPTPQPAAAVDAASPSPDAKEDSAPDSAPEATEADAASAAQPAPEAPEAEAEAETEAADEEDVVRVDAFCPQELCASFRVDDAQPGVDATDADGKPLTAVLAGELAGLQCGLVVDPAALMAAAAAAAPEAETTEGAAATPAATPGAVPALTLQLSAAKDGVNGFDAALHAAPGVRLHTALRRAAATLRVDTGLRVVCRYLAGLSHRLAGSSQDPVPGAAPVAVLLRILERYVHGVRFSSVLSAGASVNAKGDLLLEADMRCAGAGAPLVLDVEFKMSDIEKETQEMLTAVSALHAMRSRMAWTMPRWAKPPPMAAARHDIAPEEEAPEEAPAAPAPQQQGGFQLPFQNEIGNFMRGIPGMPK